MGRLLVVLLPTKKVCHPTNHHKSITQQGRQDSGVWAELVANDADGLESLQAMQRVVAAKEAISVDLERERER